MISKQGSQQAPSIFAAACQTATSDLTSPTDLVHRGETILSDYSYIPSVVFSSPHVAKVGLDEEDAVERYGDVKVYSNTFRQVLAKNEALLACMAA